MGTASAVPILVLKGLDKRFGGTHALKHVDLTFQAGEIHAIVGENGAGKSTLVKILTGVFDPPPSWLAVPWGYLIGLALLVVAGIAAAPVWTARRARRLAGHDLRSW